MVYGSSFMDHLVHMVLGGCRTHGVHRSLRGRVQGLWASHDAQNFPGTPLSEVYVRTTSPWIAFKAFHFCLGL